MKRFFLLTIALFLMMGAAVAGVYESDFTEGTDGWYARGTGECAIEVTEVGLYTYGRTGTWNSPGRQFPLIPGEEYTVSVQVLQEELDTAEFILSVERSKLGLASYQNLVFADAKKGEWTTLSATYLAGSYDTFVLYVEGAKNASFTIRNFFIEGRMQGEEIVEVDQENLVLNNDQERKQMFDRMDLQKTLKLTGQNNPLFTQRFGADPGVLVWNDRLYVYTTNDVIEYDKDGNITENTYAKINKINVISSSDLVNWTDHGAIPVAGANGIASWANHSWAPCAAHKVIDGKDKFFLYFCNGGNGVSVLVADDPAGPFSDPLGQGLITRETPNCANVLWLFDPAVFVDEDGTGYLYFGGGVPEGMTANPGTIRCVQLGDDMISIVGEPQVIDAPYVFEDSGMNRIGDKYYYSYCSNWNTNGNDLGITNGAIEYMVSDSPMGPFEYAGELFVNQGRFFGLYGNNHHSIVEFRGQHYLVYHNRPVEKAMGISGNYRSPQIDKITVNEDGTLAPVRGTMTGIGQLESVNPFEKIPSVMMYREAGIEVMGYADEAILKAESGSWIQVKGVDFHKGAKTFTLKASSKTGGAVRVCLDRTFGDVLCEITVPAGSEGVEFTVEAKSAKDVHDLFIIFAGNVEAEWWQMNQ